MDIKYKAGALIVSADSRSILFCIGEENLNDTMILLTPGGSISTNEVPSQHQQEVTLTKELKEELDLDENDYTYRMSFEAEAPAATGDLTLHMYCFSLEIKNYSKIRPNFDPDNPEQDVYLAVWLPLKALEINGGKYQIKPDTQLEVITPEGIHKKMASSEFLLTEIWTNVILPRIVDQKTQTFKI